MTFSPWRRYAASLAFELCGEEAEAGEALLASPGLRSGDPVALVGKLFASGAFKPTGRPGDIRRLGYLEKRLVMLGTVSVTPFFSMRAEDRERLGLVADLEDRLCRFRLCGAEELDKLFSGHESFMDR